MNRPARRRIARATLAVAWLTAFAFTHIPGERLPTLPASDKVLHVVAYAALALVFWLMLTAHQVRGIRRAGLVITSLILYAVFDEATQPLVNRYASVADGLADAAGVVAAVAVCDATAWVRRWWTVRA